LVPNRLADLDRNADRCLGHHSARAALASTLTDSGRPACSATGATRRAPLRGRAATGEPGEAATTGESAAATKRATAKTASATSRDPARTRPSETAGHSKSPGAAAAKAGTKSSHPGHPHSRAHHSAHGASAGRPLQPLEDQLLVTRHQADVLPPFR